MGRLGFKDTWASAFGVSPADWAGDIGGQLAPGDSVVAHAQAIPSAFKGAGGGGLSITGKLVAAVLNAGLNAVSKQRHLGGEPGTLAHTLPRDGSPAVLAFTTAGMSLWDFGPYGADGPGRRIQFIARDRVAGVADTGERAQGGVPVARVSFADGSFFDYRLTSRPGPEFWDALRAW